MKRFSFAVILILIGLSARADTGGRDAREIVRDALNHWRGLSSQGEMTMTIHRPDWERSMSMESWTQGEKRSLVRVTAPRKDRGQWHTHGRQQHVDVFTEDKQGHQGAVINDESELDGLGLLQQGHLPRRRHR